MGSFLCPATKTHNIVIIYNNNKTSIKEFVKEIIGEDVVVGEVSWELIFHTHDGYNFNFWIAKEYEPRQFFFERGYPIINITDYGRNDNMEIEKKECSVVMELLNMKDFKDSRILSIAKSKINTYNEDVFFHDTDKNKAKMITTCGFMKKHFTDNIKWLLQ
jgi:hypothetical protein